MPTQTRLLVTHDSPHRGAYVPLAFQHMVTGLQNRTILGIRIGSLGGFIDQGVALLNSPGAQQQLIMTIADGNGTVRNNTFLNDVYRPMVTFAAPGAGPQPQYRFVATSMGSQCGLPSIPVGSTLVSGEAQGNIGGVLFVLSRGIFSRFRLKVSLNAKGLQGNNNGSEILYFRWRRESSMFFGIVNTSKTFIELHRNEPTGQANPIAWESVPGGVENLRFTNQTVYAGNWSALSMGFLGYDYRFQVGERFSFLPVISALDVVNPAAYTNATIFNFAANTSTPANTFIPARVIAQESFVGTGGAEFNQPHTDFTSRNARFIFNEMQNIAQPVNCEDQCTDALTINGNDVICNSSVYKINNLPANATVTWSIPPGFTVLQLAQNTPAANQLTITNQHFYGVTNITLTATIQLNNCNITATKQIGNDNDGSNNTGFMWQQPACITTDNYSQSALGGTTTTPTYVHQGCYVYVAIGDQYTSVIASGGTPVNYGLAYYTFNNGSSTTYQRCLFFKLPPYNGSIPFNFDLSKGTGSCVKRLLFFTFGGTGKSAENAGSDFTISPIPSKTNITVKGIDNFSFSAIKIMDKMGNIKKQWRLPATTKSANLNITGLATDIYYIKVFNGTEWVGKSISVQ